MQFFLKYQMAFTVILTYTYSSLKAPFYTYLAQTYLAKAYFSKNWKAELTFSLRKNGFAGFDFS